MSPDEPLFLNNLMWLTPSSCDAPPIHWYFGQIRMLQATRHAFISISHYPGRVWLVFIEISVANLIHWSGLVVCCVVALLCDNDQVSFMILIIVTILTPSPERLLIGHMCIMKASDWWSRSHLHFPHMPRDTELPWYDSLCHDQKSEENLRKRYCQHR